MPVTVDNTYHALSIEMGVRNKIFSGATAVPGASKMHSEFR